MLLVHLFVCFFIRSILSLLSSFCCHGLACDCGNRWTSHLTFVFKFFAKKYHFYFWNKTSSDIHFVKVKNLRAVIQSKRLNV